MAGFAIYFGLLWTLWDTPLIYPLKVFVVLLHELPHAVAVWTMGGSVERIVLDRRQGGETWASGGGAPSWPCRLAASAACSGGPG